MAVTLNLSKGYRTMQRCFLLTVCFLMLVSMGCQEGPKGDPEFKKDKADTSVIDTMDKSSADRKFKPPED